MVGLSPEATIQQQAKADLVKVCSKKLTHIPLKQMDNYGEGFVQPFQKEKQNLNFTMMADGISTNPKK